MSNAYEANQQKDQLAKDLKASLKREQQFEKKFQKIERELDCYKFELKNEQ